MKYVTYLIWQQMCLNGPQNILRARIAVLLALALTEEAVATAATSTRLTGPTALRPPATATSAFEWHFM